MRIKARAAFDPTAQAEFNVPKGQGFLTLQIDADYRSKMGEEVAKIRKRQQTKLDEAVERWNSAPPAERGPKPVYRDFLVDLELDLTIHYRRRTVDQNKLYWKIRELQANWVNGCPSARSGYFSKNLPDSIITPEMLHEADVETYCEKREWTILRKDRIAFEKGMEFAEIGRVTKSRDVPDFPDRVVVTVTKTTSFFTTKEFSEWTNRVIREIEDSGLLRSDESEFMMLRNDFKEIVKGGRK